MSCLWMSLSLLFVLHHSVSSDDAVNVSCPPTVEVKAGESKTINCSIRTDCEGTSFTWSDTNGTVPCKNGNYVCDWDNRTYVSLTILTATREETITVDIYSSCGLDWGDTRVKLKGELSTSTPLNDRVVQPSPSAQPSTDPPVTAITLSVISVIIVIVGILFFLHRAKNRRKTSSHQAVTQEEMS